MSKQDKAQFDEERLKHPFDDTRMLYGDPNTDIKSIMIGVDMEVGELAVADKATGKRRPFRWQVKISNRLKLGLIPDYVFAFDFKSIL